MSRTALLILLPALLVLSGPVEALAAPASARALHCRPAAKGGFPSADFEGQMQAIRGTRRMAMRFQVQEKVGQDPWRRVDAPALRRWRRSSRGVRSFSFVQRVENLRLEGSYRVLVDFRWLGRSGQVLRTSDKASDACRAVEPVPGS